MTHSDTTQGTTIYRHHERPEWGDAILAWERENKRAYQFEDGKLRVFKKGWYEHLHEVDHPLPKAAATAARLERKQGLATMEKRAASSFDGLSFEEQLLVFRHAFPDGFAGKKWSKNRRGTDSKRRLQRHRDAAAADARETLSAAHLDAWIASESFDEAWDGIIGVIERTDLVTKTQLDPLAKLAGESRKRMVARVRELLWADDEPYEIRFERFTGALAMTCGKEPSWQLATVLSALVHPEEHVCIRPSAARAQASWMAPSLPWSPTPSAPIYLRLRDMARTIFEELGEAGMAPRDMLDIHDFMWTTLRPKAREELAEIRKQNSTDMQEAA